MRQPEENGAHIADARGTCMLVLAVGWSVLVILVVLIYVNCIMPKAG